MGSEAYDRFDTPQKSNGDARQAQSEPRLHWLFVGCRILGSPHRESP